MRRIVNCRISKEEAEEVDVFTGKTTAHKLLNQSRKINKTLPERLYDLTDWVKSRIYWFLSTYGLLNGQQEAGLNPRFLPSDQKFPELVIIRHINPRKTVNYCSQQACRCFKTITVTPLLLHTTGTAVENSINHH